MEKCLACHLDYKIGECGKCIKWYAYNYFYLNQMKKSLEWILEIPIATAWNSENGARTYIM